MELRMKELRISRGYKQEEVARKAEMPLRRYGSYEREERVVSLADAAKIADVLDCSLDELAGRKWPPEGSPILANDERALVDDFRRMEPEDRDTITRTAHTFALAGDSKKRSGETVPSMAGQPMSSSNADA